MNELSPTYQDQEITSTKSQIGSLLEDMFRDRSIKKITVTPILPTHWTNWLPSLGELVPQLKNKELQFILFLGPMVFGNGTYACLIQFECSEFVNIDYENGKTKMAYPNCEGTNYEIQKITISEESQGELTRLKILKEALEYAANVKEIERLNGE